MYISEKRGLSDIVATVLIILLAIIGVTLVGYLVFKLIQSSEDKFNCEEALNAVELEIISSSVNIIDGDVSFRIDRLDSDNTTTTFPVIEISNGTKSYSTSKYNGTDFPAFGSSPLISISKTEHMLEGEITKITIYKAVICSDESINGAGQKTDEFTPQPDSASTCGDGAFDSDGADNTADTEDDEECDDGNNANDDTCTNNCEMNVCGDGYINYGSDGVEGTSDDEEDCDLGTSNSNLYPDSACRLDCTIPECGNGVIEGNKDEECDDGNTQNTDGCSSTCKLEGSLTTLDVECGDTISAPNMIYRFVSDIVTDNDCLYVLGSSQNSVIDGQGHEITFEESPSSASLVPFGIKVVGNDTFNLTFRDISFVGFGSSLLMENVIFSRIENFDSSAKSIGIIFASSGRLTRTTVINSVISDSDRGIYLIGTNNVTVRNTLFRNNSEAFVSGILGSRTTLLDSNTFVSNIKNLSLGGATDITCINNIPAEIQGQCFSSIPTPLSCSSGQVNLTQSGFYRFNTGVKANGTCISIANVDYIILDGNGNAIDGNNTGFGINAFNVTYLEVSNFTFNDFSTGLQMVNVRNSIIRHSNFSLNFFNGIVLQNSDGNAFLENFMSSNRNGLVVDGSSDSNEFVNNIILDNTVNVDFAGGSIGNTCSPTAYPNCPNP